MYKISLAHEFCMQSIHHNYKKDQYETVFYIIFLTIIIHQQT